MHMHIKFMNTFGNWMISDGAPLGEFTALHRHPSCI